MKICVYAICKNEEKFVDRWYNSMKEADGIYVLDTGSDDNTIELLKKNGVNFTVKIIKPWRFDIARNESLKLLPKDTDVCVCTDLDEVFKKGWRKKLEKKWNKDYTRLRYTYNWHINKSNKADASFMGEKIHKLNGFKWVNPVHEILKYDGSEKVIVEKNIVLNHYPDSSKSRSYYLSLLELSIKEDPLNDRNYHYLGREYMYYRKWHKCIDTLIKHLNLSTSLWKAERSASMRFIARSYKNLKRYDEALMWFDKAIAETPTLRDPYVEKAILEYELHHWNNAINCCLKALKIKYHDKSYVNETFSWDYTIYDLLSICYYYIEDYNNALINVDIAISMSKDKRLQNNKKIFIDASHNNK